MSTPPGGGAANTKGSRATLVNGGPNEQKQDLRKKKEHGIRKGRARNKGESNDIYPPVTISYPTHGGGDSTFRVGPAATEGWDSIP